MTTLTYFTESLLIGFVIAAIIGPIGMLCIRKTLEVGFKGAMAVGLGAALADGVYGLIAVTGLTAVSHFLIAQTSYIKIVGGLLLLYLAYKELISAPPKDKLEERRVNLTRLISAVFFLTLSNPLTILSFVGIFASIGGGATTAFESGIMVLGIFFGSMAWWVILGLIIVSIKHKLPESWLHRIRYVSAAILGSFGVYAILGS